MTPELQGICNLAQTHTWTIRSDNLYINLVKITELISIEVLGERSPDRVEVTVVFKEEFSQEIGRNAIACTASDMKRALHKATKKIAELVQPGLRQAQKPDPLP
jgi:predicted metal-binding transcription factor (methanogenesis marker protein 9)